jgi:uncharacterized protein YbaR (Trm112 family)
MVEPLLEMAACPVCHGARLSQAALGCRINGHNIAELSALEVDELIPAVKAIRAPTLAPIVAALVERGPDALTPLHGAMWSQAADDGARLRVVVDQVASLTDASAVEWHRRLCG